MTAIISQHRVLHLATRRVGAGLEVSSINSLRPFILELLLACFLQ